MIIRPAALEFKCKIGDKEVGFIEVSYRASGIVQDDVGADTTKALSTSWPHSYGSHPMPKSENDSDDEDVSGST
jgi:hypothetical protein